MRALLPLLLLPAAAAADPFALDWLATCRANASGPEQEGACAEDAVRLVCAYAAAPGSCRDAVDAAVTAEAFARLAALADARGASMGALLQDVTGGAAAPDCQRPPPPLTEAGCLGQSLGALLAAVAEAERR